MAPPPLPVQQTQSFIQPILAKAKITPATTMKPLFWNTIAPQKVSNTIWMHTDDTKIELDIDLLISSFGQKKPAPKSASSGAKEEAKAAQPKVPAKISFLTKERSQNIEIVLGKLKLSNSAIVEALLSCDATILTESTLVSLK
jgi:hypothetical protein